MGAARWGHKATLLPSGRVLAAGGLGLSIAEPWNPATNTWSPADSMSGVQYAHIASLLPDGRVLVAGGYDGSAILSGAELYQPTTPPDPQAEIQETLNFVAAMSTSQFHAPGHRNALSNLRNDAFLARRADPVLARSTPLPLQPMRAPVVRMRDLWPHRETRSRMLPAPRRGMSMKPSLLLASVLLVAAAARAEDAKPAEITIDPATWPADVKAAYDDIKAMPLEKKAEIKGAMFALAAKGRLARPAIGALADAAALPEPQRALGGILFAHFARFDPAALRKLAESANPFAQLEAIVLLCQLGATDDAEFLEELSKRTESQSLKSHITKAVAAMPAEPLPSRALELLDRVVNAAEDTKRESCAVLSEDYGRKAQPALLAIVKDGVTDDDARLYASAAIARANADSVADLEALCARSNHKILRWSAMRELGKKGDEGKAVLRKLLESADEPLKPNIEKLLGAEEK